MILEKDLLEIMRREVLQLSEEEKKEWDDETLAFAMEELISKNLLRIGKNYKISLTSEGIRMAQAMAEAQEKDPAGLDNLPVKERYDNKHDGEEQYAT
jgi:hypothetical protein